MKVIDIKLFQTRRRMSSFGAAVQFDYAYDRFWAWVQRKWNAISPW